DKEERRRRGDRAPDHHQRELRPPLAENVEEAEHVRGICHPRDQQAGTEQCARDERREKFHGGRPCRTTANVRTAGDMDTTVCTSERRDRFARPQTPWPLVHPLPSRAPIPTSNPATSASTQLAGSRGSPTPHTSAGNNKPARKASRQACSPGCAPTAFA